MVVGTFANNAKYMIFSFVIMSEAATVGVLLTNVFLEISQNSQENTCASDVY